MLVIHRAALDPIQLGVRTCGCVPRHHESTLQAAGVLVAALLVIGHDALEGAHALDDVSERGLVWSASPQSDAIWRERDEQMGGARVPAIACEGQRPVLEGHLVRLVLQSTVGQIVHLLVLGISSDAKLHEETRNNTVKKLAVHEAVAYHGDEAFDAQWGQRVVELEDKVAHTRRAGDALLRHAQRREQQQQAATS